MNELPLVSIIIPTFNRAHLICETLDSVLAQTYTNWECIVVDDGSYDNTAEVVGAYSINEARFQYHQRPPGFLSGGNGARNYGFKLSKGDYIQWFDSDDIMLPNKLLLMVNAIQGHHVDFVISKSRFLNLNKELYHYNFTTADICFENYAMGNVSWYICDFIIKREVVENLSFNEVLRSGQEYNFCCKVLLKTSKVFLLNEVLSEVRDTPNSIGNSRRKIKVDYLDTRLKAYWQTFLDVKQITKHVNYEKFALITCTSCFLRSRNKIKLPIGYTNSMIEVFGFKMIYFVLARLSNVLFRRYHFFYNRLKNN